MKSVTIVILMVLLCPAVWPLDITGKVTDQQGQPLIGVSILTDKPGVGTVTDESGEYALPFDEQVTRVIFSHVGFRPQQIDLDRLPDVVVLKPMYVRGKDIVVTADRAQIGVSSIAFDNLSSDEINRDYTVGEFPLLLETSPNLFAYSDAGSALGYSYMKIRGFDDKRVVTYINGVPLNDPEDHATYFVDIPDFAANVEDVQVQRGVGNSLYGDASFGGSINIVTSIFTRPRQTTLTAGYGEYTAGGKSVSDLYKQSVEYSSGLIDGRWTFSGRFSKQKSGGYRYNSWYEGWSYYFAIGRLDPNMSTELYVYGGPMRMHLAYYGAGRSDLEQDRRVNPYNTYSNQTDNFNQPHYHLHNTYRFNDRITLSNTLYHIRGKGYYEQFKDDRDYVEYDLTALSDSSAGDLVRQKWVFKSQFGWNPRLSIEHSRGTHNLGGSLYYFESDHWGEVVQAEFLNGVLEKGTRYYDYAGKKYVGSLFATEDLRLTDKLAGQLTAQLRFQKSQFDQERAGAFKGYDYDIGFLFFSPRIGISYAVDTNLNLFANFAIASRTPSDGAVYEADDPWKLPSLEITRMSVTATNDTLYEFGDPLVRNERVYDFELGGDYTHRRYRVGINLFWMIFNDEILSYDIVEDLPFSINIDRSVHAGVELSGSVAPLRNLSVSGNFAYNYNRVKEFIRDLGGFDIDFADKKLSGFPDYLGNVIADFDRHPWRLTWRARFVGRQYMELWNVDEISIDPFFTSSLSARYCFANVLNVGDITLSVRVDNLFDKKYELSGYGDNYAYPDGLGNPVVEGWAEYFVAPERSFYGQMQMGLF